MVFIRSTKFVKIDQLLQTLRQIYAYTQHDDVMSLLSGAFITKGCKNASVCITMSVCLSVSFSFKNSRIAEGLKFVDKFQFWLKPGRH
jgi:hypothetical protein